MATIEALRLLRRLGLRPRRTIRAVLWTNEENGLRGAKNYAEVHAAELPRHVAALEADMGAFAPTGFDVDHTDTMAGARSLKRLEAWRPLFMPLGRLQMKAGFAGSDLEPMKDAGVPLLGQRTDPSRYFDIHHTAADTLDKVDRAEFEANVAAMALMAWLLAESPDRIDRGSAAPAVSGLHDKGAPASR